MGRATVVFDTNPLGWQQRIPDVLTLIAVGILAGVVTGLSPCVLPVLPVVLTTSAAGPVVNADQPTDERTSRARPFIVVAGLVTSFALATLVGGALLSFLGLPQDLLRTVGIVAMLVVGVGFLIPQVAHLLERPFARLPQADARKQSSAFLFGAVFGLVFVPCAGPVLATITVVAASQSLGWPLVVLTVSFAIGVAIPLLGIAVAGQQMAARISVLRRHMPTIRRVTGVVLIVTALAIAFNVTDTLQRFVPSYVNAAQTTLESNPTAKHALAQVTHQGATQAQSATAMSFDDCSNDPTVLHNCGAAPGLTGLDAWLNTPGDKPLTIAGLKGHVVLVDFWTYSCINCQRTLPYLEAWDKAYRKAGLVIIGVHTPEFAFEHVVSNVKSQSAALGVRYPVAIDNSYATWNAYHQQYWPAHYLIDKSGTVRQVHYGEGQYSTTESLIRKLLRDTTSTTLTSDSVQAPVPMAGTTPETYLGSERGQSYMNTDFGPGQHDFGKAPAPSADAVSLGGTWSVSPQYIEAKSASTLSLNYVASRVYLVIGGRGQLTVQDGSSKPVALAIAGPPRLYQLRAGTAMRNVLELAVGPGVRLYSFTFG